MASDVRLFTRDAQRLNLLDAQFPHYHTLRSDLIPYTFTAPCIPPTPVPPASAPKRHCPSSSITSDYVSLLSNDSAAAVERVGEHDGGTSTGGYACNWNIYAPSAVVRAGVDERNLDSNLRGIYNSGSSTNAAHVVNDGGDIIINFEVFHCSQGKVMLAFACLGSNSLADLIDFLHPTFIIGKKRHSPLSTASHTSAR